jgi:hypothetical protein
MMAIVAAMAAVHLALPSSKGNYPNDPMTVL